MAREKATFRDGELVITSLAPDVCLTPIGPMVVPVPYPISHTLAAAKQCSPDVFINDAPVFLHAESFADGAKGDEPGVRGGVVTGVHGRVSHSIDRSPSVFVNGKPMVRTGDRMWMNQRVPAQPAGSELQAPQKQADLAPVATGSPSPTPTGRAGPGAIGNTVGLITPKPSVNGSIRDGRPTSATDPPAQPETADEPSFWSKASQGVHAGLDVLGFVPGVGVVPDLANAGIYVLEGNYVAAVASAVAAIPGAGDAVKAGTMIAKGGMAFGREVIEEAGTRAGKEATERIEREATERALNEKAHNQLAEEAGVPTGKREAARAGGAPPRQDGGYSRSQGKGPCDHFRKGRGSGPYRGGAHRETRKPQGDGRDSHHIPADNVTALPRGDGPAIQMDQSDHRFTASNGASPESVRYRKLLKAMIEQGAWRDAMAMEIRDVRRIAREAEQPRKYDEAIKEMLDYFECLDAHGLLQ